jgi:PmbA protein
MSAKDFAQSALTALTKRGFQKAQVRLTESERHELQAEFNEMSLFRTTQNRQLALTGIVDARRGTVTLNKLDEAALAEGVEELWQVARGGQPDEANDIAPAQPAKTFSSGPASPDYDAMYDRLAELLSYARAEYPLLTVRSAIVEFVTQSAYFMNSNGVDYASERANYAARAAVSARDGEDVSSFNGSGFSAKNLERPLHECGSLDDVMRQNTEQVRTKKIPRKFVGDLFVTPDCVLSFLRFLLMNIGNQPLIAGTSVYKDKLGEVATASNLTLHSRPVSEDMATGYFVTGDGFEAEDATIVANGVLCSFLLDLYGANKTGLERSKTDGGCYVIDPVKGSFEDLTGHVDEGILITRFSGGNPSPKGDFSGVAKNSYYVAGGKIRHPVSETMIAGNLVDMLNNIEEISAERVDFGNQILPWLRISGVSVS